MSVGLGFTLFHGGTFNNGIARPPSVAIPPPPQDSSTSFFCYTSCIRNADRWRSLPYSQNMGIVITVRGHSVVILSFLFSHPFVDVVWKLRGGVGEEDMEGNHRRV